MKLKAMVIDDSRVMRTMVMKALKQTMLADFEFIEAEDGKDALQKFSPRSIDILFVDWNMPNMSGIDFVREVKSMKDTERVPIVMVTSEKTMGKIETALDEAGADSYICKPFTVEDLQRKLSRVIEGIAEEGKKSRGFFGKIMSGS